MGIATTAALVVLAPVVGSALGDPGATDVLRGLAITFTLMGIAKVPQAMLRREMRYRAIAGLDTINALVTGIVAVPLAATGHGVASLVVGQVVAVGVEVVLTVVTVRWWPTSGFHRSELRKISGFARNLFAFNLVSYFADAGDKFIVGRFVGTASLGIYNLPYRLLLSPVFAVGQVVRELLLPVFSRNQHDNDAIARVYLRAISMLALVSFPATALTAALGGPLVDTALGPKWQEAGPILTVLAVVALELSVLVTSGVILRAKGRTDILFRWGVVAGATNFVCYAIGAQWGVMGVAAAFLFGTTILAYPAMAIPFRQIDLPMARLGQVLLAPSLVAAATAGAAAATRVAAESAGMAPIAVLVVGTLAGASALLVSLLILRPPALADLLANVTRRRRR
jgi:PST family polysaccharide transporter